MTDKLTLYRRSRLTETGCWEWIGARTTAGYGEINRKRRVRYVHRIAWELHHGPIPAGKWVLHRCDNPPCWNPDHLFLGTDQDNTDDKIRKGRMRHGHLYGEDNPNAILTQALAKEILRRRAAGQGPTFISTSMKLKRSTVSNVFYGAAWKRHTNG